MGLAGGIHGYHTLMMGGRAACKNNTYHPNIYIPSCLYIRILRAPGGVCGWRH